MFIKRADKIKSSEITSESVYHSRRRFIGHGAAALGAIALNPNSVYASRRTDVEWQRSLIARGAKQTYRIKEKITPYNIATTHNNFYEFGTDKSDPSEYAKELNTADWKVKVEGEVEKPATYLVEDLLGSLSLEDRVYRLRCVEAWSMVIPWLGFSLASLIKKLKPTSRAKYVYFETLYDPKQFRGQRSVFSSINWPYVEGLRMDEAMNPLSFIAIGMYGKSLPNQNGAPLRLVVPWKYGFKSIKSIVKIRFLEQRLPTTWESIAPNEYGFYANVNPHVDHPRWSQKTERRLPSSLFSPNRRETLMFNGYGEEVADMYSGMDLAKYF